MDKIRTSAKSFGKKLIFLPLCRSTNDTARIMADDGDLKEGGVVLTDRQTSGRGAGGTSWEAEAGKNLTFSLLLEPRFLEASRQFDLSIAVCLGLLNGVRTLFEAEAVKNNFLLKWPNDLCFGNEKIAGVLIENTLSGYHIQQSIAGIGLNVNQEKFEEKRAMSLCLIAGQSFRLRDVLTALLSEIEKNYEFLRNGEVEMLRSAYHKSLFGFGEERLFSDGKNQFRAEVAGVSPEGLLKLRTSSGIQFFDFKTVKWIWE